MDDYSAFLKQAASPDDTSEEAQHLKALQLVAPDQFNAIREKYRTEYMNQNDKALQASPDYKQFSKDASGQSGISTGVDPERYSQIRSLYSRQEEVPRKLPLDQDKDFKMFQSVANSPDAMPAEEDILQSVKGFDPEKYQAIRELIKSKMNIQE